jgi:hypothetical protein
MRVDLYFFGRRIGEAVRQRNPVKRLARLQFSEEHVMGQQKRMPRTSRLRKPGFPILWTHFASGDNKNIADQP